MNETTAILRNKLEAQKLLEVAYDELENKTAVLLQDCLGNMMRMKGADRGDRNRYLAIAITDLQKLIAFWNMYVWGDGDSG